MTDERPLRAVIFGGAGQLGRALSAAAAASRVSLRALSRSECDVADPAAVADALSLRPDFVINAAAYTALDRANREPDLAFRTNRDGAAIAAASCARACVPFMHISTDCVFNGRKQGAYGEEDAPSPISIYGLSKLEGERLVLSVHPRAAVVRTAWLFGPGGGNFVKTIVRLAAERDELTVVADQIGCPTSAQHLAVALFTLARRMIDDPMLSGIFHYVGTGPVSRHAFAQEIVSWVAPRLARRPVVTPVATWERPLAARRPLNAVLACTRLSALGLPPLPWRAQAQSLAVAEAALRAEGVPSAHFVTAA